MADLQKILKAGEALTLAGAPAGFLPWLMADLARAAKGRAVFVAPDDRQMGVSADGHVRVTDEPAVNGLRPSATYLFQSVARAYGTSALAVILTGMGKDGVEGLRALRAQGGQVIAQDESSSVVYGMPGEAVAAGVVDAVVPVEEIAARLRELVATREAQGEP